MARTSCDASDNGLLQSYAQLQRDLLDVIRLRRRKAFLDESHAGPLLATINQLWDNKEHLLQRNQVLQAAAATQTQDELAKAQAVTIAAEDRAADAEQQLNAANGRIAQLMTQGTELENQNELLQSLPQAQADMALQQRLAASESQVRQLPAQVLTLNQQLLGMTQQSHQYLQEILRMRTPVATVTTSSPMAGAFPYREGAPQPTPPRFFAGSGATLGMFAPMQATPPAGVPG